MIHERAVTTAERYGIPKAYSVAEMLADPDVDLVLNLTPPQDHVDVILSAIRAGKHVYSEKPLPSKGRTARRSCVRPPSAA